ncbi:MAG TPA: helix-turn-helix transcriptional regulator [Steroidobacteraceae bacterium]
MGRLTMHAAKRREFGAFLRSRRERLTPEYVGLPRGSRRRTPGLRREEVAMLAGVGTTWYTWLEQGRDVQPSAEVLTALAETLRLNRAERRHVFVLNNRAFPEPSVAEPEKVTAPLLRMLESLTTQPAYILGRRWDILAWNRAAAVLFCDYAKLPDDERNIMHLLFLNKHHRGLLLDWDELAPAALAMFRADSARYVGDPDFARLIDRLRRSSPEFEMWWSKHKISTHITNRKSIKHPVAGRMRFEYSSLIIAEQQEMKLVVYTPLEEENTSAKLNQLLCSENANPST